ncbi:glycosyltransferase family 4 protein [Flavobacterium sp. CYK-4]|uniref:glycosyltransferase n=1 Tax=Flavobacterium lotistagni TaxID=2709660 RepID=UPI0014092EE0|nr:glycosyltransferase [Flavobacterium lotistagni]NHM07785.1 glycosyltransferase family 4 protein [Flavobacterium lotistagni]
MNRIKIAHVIHSVGGVDVYLRLITENIDCTQFENIVVHGNRDTQVPFTDAEGNAIKEYTTSITRNISVLEDIKATLNTYRYLKKERPDLIHAHSAKGGVIGKVVGAIFGVKVLYTPNAFSFLSSENKIKRSFFVWIERLLANKNSILLATSNSEKQQGINVAGYQPENTIVFENSIEPINELAPRQIEQTWPDNYICTVGRPSYQKNIELMLEILSKVLQMVDTHLVVMGVGNHSDQLDSVKEKIVALNLTDKVTLLDWTSRNDVFHIIRQSKLYLSTARYEGLPYSVIESLALSKAAVVTDCDGNRDLIKDGYNGYVIESDDKKKFAEKVIQLLTDENLLSRFSKNAYKEFTQNYDILKNIKKLETTYLKYSGKC